MKIIRRVMLLIVVFMIAVSIKGNTAFAEYVIQVVPTSTTNPVWTTISVSDAYDACQNLNKNYSTLGTESLKAHLTTNADWYAVSLLTYSLYGNENAGKKVNNTTGNNTGIMNFGTVYTFTSSIMEGPSINDDRKSLYNNIGTSYVETVKNKTNRDFNEKGRGLLPGEYITSQYGDIYIGDESKLPITIRNKLFGFTIGTAWYPQNGSTGNPRSDITFRPVIWNK